MKWDDIRNQNGIIGSEIRVHMPGFGDDELVFRGIVKGLLWESGFPVFEVKFLAKTKLGSGVWLAAESELDLCQPYSAAEIKHGVRKGKAMFSDPWPTQENGFQFLAFQGLRLVVITSQAESSFEVPNPSTSTKSSGFNPSEGEPLVVCP